MQVYNYDEHTFEYVNASIADESPLEPGVYHIPAHATDIAPPEDVPGKVRVFTGNGWVYQDVAPAVEEIPSTVENTPVPEELMNSYIYQRQINYPSIGDQLDALFKAGVFPPEMAAQIQAIKDQYPKTVS